jgi:hypothetical protein
MAYHRLSFGGLNDDSHDSSNTMPDISLGSLEESFKSPPRSLTQHPPPLSLLGSTTMTNSSNSARPATPKKTLVRRTTEDEARTPKPSDKKADWLDDSLEDEDKDGDRKWESDNPAVARLARSRSGTGAQKAGVNMTLREQEKVSKSFHRHFIMHSIPNTQASRAAYYARLNLRLATEWNVTAILTCHRSLTS